MSVYMLREAVRISDRFYGVGDVESITGQGRFQNCIVLVVIFHMLMAITFLKLEELELAHPHIIRDVNVQFEFIPPPPPPPPPAVELPKALSLTAGDLPAPGSEAAPKPLASDKIDIPSVVAPEVESEPTAVPAKPVPSHRTTVAPPVAVTPTQIIKAKTPLGQVTPKESPKPRPDPTTAGAAAERALSGTATQGGAPDGAAAGTGTGGEGTGGTGVGEGDKGDGTGFGTAGGVPIATRLPTRARRAMGNIAPYRKDLLMRVAQNWKPKKKNIHLIVLLTVDHDGNLLGAEVFKSSGKKKEDKRALKAIEETRFAPLPDWYKGNHLTFKVQLSKVEANR